MPPPMIDDTQLLAQFSQMYRTAVDSFADNIGMHRGQGLLLCVVARQEGMTQSEIADMLSVQGATVTNMLQRMEESALVVRQRDANDNRLVRVYMTDAGRDKELQLREQFSAFEETLLTGLSEAERDTLRRLLMKLIANMELHT